MTQLLVGWAGPGLVTSTAPAGGPAGRNGLTLRREPGSPGPGGGPRSGPWRRWRKSGRGTFKLEYDFKPALT